MDNKYKSISTILREMSANRNSELRKKVVNVGRPDTAEDPTDVKSKLAKQGEIKTKIIDEVMTDVGPNQGPLDEINVGDTVHAGFGTKGGAGFKGKVHKVEGDDVHINIGKGKYGDRIVKAPKRLVTKEEVEITEDSDDSQSAYYKKMVDVAKSAGSPNPELTAAISSHETGFGSSRMARKGNNMFGQTITSKQVGSNGITGSMTGADGQAHASYDSPESSVKHHLSKWDKNYVPGDAGASLKNLVKSGYNTVDPNWSSSITSIAKKFGGLFKDEPKPTPPKDIPNAPAAKASEPSTRGVPKPPAAPAAPAKTPAAPSSTGRSAAGQEFDKEYAAQKKAGAKSFNWKGKTYTTEEAEIEEGKTFTKPKGDIKRQKEMLRRFAALAAEKEKSEKKPEKDEKVEVKEASVAAIDKGDVVAKEKTVDSPETKDKKKKSDTDSVDAKEVKGGKTEVELNPRTNDNVETQDTEDKESKKARKAANKEIGAKGMKEETMFKSDNTFGLPSGLIDAVKSIVEKKLVGDQKKLDKNHNGKLDAEDFKKLRNEEVCPKCGKSPCKCKAVKEEVEQIDEISDKLKKSYIKGATKDYTSTSVGGGGNQDVKIKLKRLKGIAKASEKMSEEVEFSAEELARIEAIAKDME